MILISVINMVAISQDNAQRRTALEVSMRRFQSGLISRWTTERVLLFAVCELWAM